MAAVLFFNLLGSKNPKPYVFGFLLPWGEGGREATG
jgi:hypothetical protein